MQALYRAASPDVGIRYCCAVAKHQVLIEMNCFDAAKAKSKNGECYSFIYRP